MNRMQKMIAERYIIKDSIGEGGMADVYLAEDTILNREVAIKVLRGELSKDPVTLLRFQREASAVSKLSHPNVVDVYDVGEYDGHHYIVMEYVRGRTLKQLISQRGALHKEEAVDIMIQLTSAVQHAHEHNIIHRDIKPQNVLVKDDGTIKITDFGIALAHDSVQLTQSDAVLGSAHYLAPETTRGETPTNQVDIYALGIVFYELLTGSVPFRGDNPVQIAMKHLREEVPSVCEFNPTLPQSIENIIIHATVKNRKLRYQSTKEMLYDLEHCLDASNAHVKKLSFAQEQDPTLIMKEQKKVTQHKPRQAKVMEIPDEDDHPQKAEQQKTKKKKHKTPLIIGICIAIGALVAFMIFTNIMSPKEAAIPEVIDLAKDEAITKLSEAGFAKDKIKIEEKLTDDKSSGTVVDIYPKAGSKYKTSDPITLTISKGMYYIVEDYKNRPYEDVKKELEEYAPKVKLIVKEKENAEYKPGYIIEQSGLNIGEKLDPQQPCELYVTVTKRVEFTIQLNGKTVEEAQNILGEKGIIPVLVQMDKPEDEEDVEEGVVVKSDPVEGSWYIQEGSNTITLYYY